MKLIRIRVADHQLLQQLAGYLLELAVPEPLELIDRGDLTADLFAGPPHDGRTRPLASRFVRMSWTRPPWMPDGVTLASVNYFPAGGGLGWHNDASAPGWRVYLGRPLGAEPGRFMYRTGVVLDAPGVATAFQVTGHSADSWHAVWSPGPRFSVGIRFRTPAAADELLGLSHGGVYRFGTASE